MSNLCKTLIYNELRGGVNSKSHFRHPRFCGNINKVETQSKASLSASSWIFFVPSVAIPLRGMEYVCYSIRGDLWRYRHVTCFCRRLYEQATLSIPRRGN